MISLDGMGKDKMDAQVLRGNVWDSAKSQFVSAEVRWNSDGVIEEIQPLVQVGSTEMVVPGFIDEHIHGAGGLDSMDASQDLFSGISGELVKYGVTAYVLTTMSASPESLHRTLTAVGAYSAGPGAEMLGVHLEGPFLSPQYCGAQPKHRLRGVNRQELETLLEVSHGKIRIITLAPELPGALELMSWLTKEGIRVNVGHTAADFNETSQGIDVGADGMTHLFNGMPPLHHRNPGPVGLALSDPRVYVEVIADGVHLDPSVVRMIFAAAAGRVIAITDGVSAIGLPPGKYRLGELEVMVDAQAVRLPSGSLAGSKLTLDQAYRNLLAWGISESAVIDALSTRAAQRLDLRQQGILAPGFYADMVVLDDQRNVQKTILRGKVVYAKALS